MSTTIDITPTWQSAVRIYMAAIRDCDPKKRSEVIDTAEKEFLRMAEEVDSMNAKNRRAA